MKYLLITIALTGGCATTQPPKQVQSPLQPTPWELKKTEQAERRDMERAICPNDLGVQQATALYEEVMDERARLRGIATLTCETRGYTTAACTTATREATIYDGSTDDPNSYQHLNLRMRKACTAAIANN